MARTIDLYDTDDREVLYRGAMTMPVVITDGGRAASGFNGKARDCVCRSIAIASGLDYDTVYWALAQGNKTQRRSRHGKRPGRDNIATANHGIDTNRKWFKDLMAEWGFEWVPCMGIGTGCTVNLKPGALPAGRLVVSLSKHYTAVIEGVIHDDHDPSRGGTRCVYGYWRKG